MKRAHPLRRARRKFDDLLPFNGGTAAQRIFTTLYHSHTYKYAFVWQCVITVDYNALLFLLSVFVA